MFGVNGGNTLFPVDYNAGVKKENNAMLDSAAGNAVQALEVSDNSGVALNSEIQNLRKAALALVLVLTDSIIDNDLAEDELPTDRLDTLIGGLASDVDDEDFEADQTTLDILIANVQDAFASLGVSDETILAMFSTEAEADDAIELAAEIVESNVPSGDDLDEFIDLFVYGEAQDEGEDTMLDGISLGKTTTKSGKFGKVVYKAVKAIRNGKVTLVNKRMSGRVKLSAKQRTALNKARKKASSSSAIKQRLRSMKKAKKLNL